MERDSKQSFAAAGVFILLVMGIVFFTQPVRETVGNALQQEPEGPCVVIDAGHGGDDPGKIGINGAKEKDVNLSIARRVKAYLEKEDIRVIMTRETEDGLYDADASHKKVQDMKRRIAIIEETAPDLTVSIHQNSYSAEYVHGAQVFYYSTSSGGKALAECIQEHLISEADPSNTRAAKGNSEYLVLRESPCTAVIVECGFLSNTKECSDLCNDEYQTALANAICNAVCTWHEQHAK